MVAHAVGSIVSTFARSEPIGVKGLTMLVETKTKIRIQRENGMASLPPLTPLHTDATLSQAKLRYEALDHSTFCNNSNVVPSGSRKYTAFTL